MTNGDWLRSLTNEQISEFLAVDRYMRFEKLFEYIGYVITKEVMYLQTLKWVNQKYNECDVNEC